MNSGWGLTLKSIAALAMNMSVAGWDDGSKCRFAKARPEPDFRYRSKRAFAE